MAPSFIVVRSSFVVKPPLIGEVAKRPERLVGRGRPCRARRSQAAVRENHTTLTRQVYSQVFMAGRPTSGSAPTHDGRQRRPLFTGRMPPVVKPCHIDQFGRWPTVRGGPP